MSKLKYTPGPWTTDGVYIEDYDNNCPLRRRIAIIDDGAGIDSPDANARLIAAAPEMLEMLILFYDFQKLYDFDDEIIIMLKTIIEKATGLSIEEVLTNE